MPYLSEKEGERRRLDINMGNGQVKINDKKLDNSKEDKYLQHAYTDTYHLCHSSNQHG